jgi:hypothetical protein
MIGRRFPRRFPATLLIATLPLIAAPVGAADAVASLTGSIVRAADRSPLEGARLHAGDPRTGDLFSSEPADADGNFALPDLPAATYALAVESEGGLYLVEAPLALAPGATRTVNFAVNADPVNRESGPDWKNTGDEFSFTNNPLTATLVLLGVATVIGLLLDDDPDRPGSTSPSQPN